MLSVILRTIYIAVVSPLDVMPYGYDRLYQAQATSKTRKDNKADITDLHLDLHLRLLQSTARTYIRQHTEQIFCLGSATPTAICYRYVLCTVQDTTAILRQLRT